ncbi:hypothetical protein AB0H42_00790 [Nocardia sp. NPDC050799]|uniref:hypothetical protein n=1 Tax=Nocardia sp. NPDC050799 TaxID=3154842 RepID=UPI00340E008C
MNPTSSSFLSCTLRSRDPGVQLSFRTHRRGDFVVLSARGEADAFTLPWWRHSVRAAAEVAATAGGVLIIDATRLDFLSLRTLAAVAWDADRYRRVGVQICLVSSDSRLTRLAGRHQQTARLLMCSSIVSAFSVLQLHKRAEPRSYPLPAVAAETEHDHHPARGSAPDLP